MADRVDAAVEAVQASGAHPPPDRLVAQAGRTKRGAGHHPVLIGGELSDHQVGWALVLSKCGSFAAHPASVAGSG